MNDNRRENYYEQKYNELNEKVEAAKNTILALLIGIVGLVVEILAYLSDSYIFKLIGVSALSYFLDKRTGNVFRYMLFAGAVYAVGVFCNYFTDVQSKDIFDVYILIYSAYWLGVSITCPWAEHIIATGKIPTGEMPFSHKIMLSLHKIFMFIMVIVLCIIFFV